MNPFQSAPASKKMLTLVGLYLGVIANLMVSSTNATLLPAAAADIGGMEIYGLAQGISGVLGICAMPIFGFVGARSPHLKRLLAGGALGVGAVVILARALAPSMVVIIAANVFWGLVSAGVFVIGFTMVRDMYDQKQAGFYLGLNGTMMSAAMIAGPFLGGLVIDNVGWRAWCFVTFGVLALACVMILFGGIKVNREDARGLAVKGGSFDYVGGVAVTLFLGSLIIMLSLGGSAIPFGSAASGALAGVSVAALVVLVLVIRKKGDDAIVPLSAVKDRNTLVLASDNLLHNLGAMSITFFVPAFVMLQLAEDPLVVTLGPALAGGLTTVFLALLGLVLGPVFGKMIAKDSSAKRSLTMGNVVRVAVMAALLFALAPGTPVWIIYLIMLVAGFYNSNMTVAMSAGPQIQLKPELRVTGNSVIQLGQNLGAGIGVALFTFLVGADPIHGMTTCIVISLACYAAMFFITLLLKRGGSAAQPGSGSELAAEAEAEAQPA